MRLSQRGGKTIVHELWFNEQMQMAFLNAVRIGRHIYGAHGNSVRRFSRRGCRDGKTTWRHRGFGKSTLIHADGKAIISTKTATSPRDAVSERDERIVTGADFRHGVVDRADAGRDNVYARDREKVVALDLGAPK